MPDPMTPPPDAADDEVDFGFADVPRAAKRRLVDGVFSDVAARYDLMNDLMSLGVHRAWKAALIDRLCPRPGMTLLDVAGGTGDVARAFAEHVNLRLRRTDAATRDTRAMICDINFEMTSAGRDRLIDRPLTVDGPVAIDFVCGDAERLPLRDAGVDAVTIAFGLRNVTDRTAALGEARRVLKPGGCYLVLELCPVDQPLLGGLYDIYSFRVLPQIGALVARNRAAYQYLVESIRRFPAADALAAELEAAGFGRVSYQRLSGGIAALHVGWRT